MPFIIVAPLLNTSTGLGRLPGGSETFAAIAPLAAFLYSSPSMESIKGLPVWAIHGADDTVVPLSVAQQPVDALKLAGGNVRFTVLEGHDHDVWTDTYSDPQFYDWLLQHQRP